MEDTKDKVTGAEVALDIWNSVKALFKIAFSLVVLFVLGVLTYAAYEVYTGALVLR